jgi:hypothetical protein
MGEGPLSPQVQMAKRQRRGGNVNLLKGRCLRGPVGRRYARAAAAVSGMDRFSDTNWQNLEQYVAQLAAHAKQPVQPAQTRAQTRRVIRSRYLDSHRTGDWLNRWWD